MTKPGGKYGTANSRWAGMGPYFAMFPSAFADEVVRTYSSTGDTILDPFAGRGTALFSAASASRNAIGIEINPVGWIYCKTKLNPAPQDKALERIREIASSSAGYQGAASRLPEFFQKCFSFDVLSFLVCARVLLDWQDNDVDRTVMAFLLINLHGKSTDSFSNQMRQTKAMSPGYAVQWWKDRDLAPPDVVPSDFLTKKLGWRYAKGAPAVAKSLVLLGDCEVRLDDAGRALEEMGLPAPALMLTSPPYLGITDYHYDQWIRLWLLGGPPDARRTGTQFRGKHRGKFANIEDYRYLLRTVFSNSAKILKKDATVYVRTDQREPTASITKQSLEAAFPTHQLCQLSQPSVNSTQTRLFGNTDPRFGEIDFILSPT